ncbi:hypothetical protein [Chitinivorax sp. B]|uniref:hypothetical protein n=1 Tax=Chitinivorax sp. B TaxID=2502235 RepID=UPI0010F979A1|nr:hypothetical protein [Chitinivorax sp. B]
MILLVHSNMSAITDFIMWADVEFAMQLELLETKRFDTQDCTIIDLSGADKLANIAQGEPLYVVCHGGEGSSTTYLDGEEYDWQALGKDIGTKMSAHAKDIILFACYAAHGQQGHRPIDMFATGIQSAGKKGVKITGYQGATVTNTMGTVTAREFGGVNHEPILVANAQPSKMKKAGKIDNQLRDTFTPQIQFDAFLKSVPKATPRAKAIAAADKAESFYAAFSKAFIEKQLYYPVGHQNALPIVVYAN